MYLVSLGIDSRLRLRCNLVVEQIFLGFLQNISETRSVYSVAQRLTSVCMGVRRHYSKLSGDTFLSLLSFGMRFVITCAADMDI